MQTKLLMTALVTAMSLPVFAADTDTRSDERSGRDVVVRDTSSVYTVNDRRRPLTSTYLDTTSTRLVDARRGFRPYDTVYRDTRSNNRRLSSRVYRDVYGPSRRASQGFYDPNPPAPRTGVTAYYGGDRKAGANQGQGNPPILVIIRDERDTEREAPRDDARPKPGQQVMEVTIYEGEPEMPERSGAVIVRSDGTVISVGD